jgi:hypothetical protein
VAAPLIGAVSGLLAARWFLRRLPGLDPAEPSDPFISAQIDQAAVKWASEQGRPEAAGLMADKLHLLYALDQRRRQP